MAIFAGASLPAAAVEPAEGTTWPVEPRLTDEALHVLLGEGFPAEPLAVEVVLAQYSHLDVDCRDRHVLVRTMWEPRASGDSTTLALADLGVDPSPLCNAWAITARVTGSESGRDALVSRVGRDALAAGTLDCANPPTSDQLAADLVFTNEISLNAFHGGAGGCLGLREYALQLTNRPGSGSEYGVHIDAKYICPRNKQTPQACGPAGQPPGAGWNRGQETPAVDGRLSPGECFLFQFLNDQGQFPLPGCCDSAPAAVQCASYSVTSVDGTPCAPAFLSPVTFAEDNRDGIGVAFGCSFNPTNLNTNVGFLCEFDSDLDGSTDICDCASADPQAWDTPGEARGLLLSHVGSSGTTTLDWSPPARPGGSSLVYDVLRSPDASDFLQGTDCTEQDDGPDTTAVDTETPLTGSTFHYLVRAENACPDGSGTLGNVSSGSVRQGRACP